MRPVMCAVSGRTNHTASSAPCSGVGSRPNQERRTASSTSWGVALDRSSGVSVGPGPKALTVML